MLFYKRLFSSKRYFSVTVSATGLAWALLIILVLQPLSDSYKLAVGQSVLLVPVGCRARMRGSNEQRKPTGVIDKGLILKSNLIEGFISCWLLVDWRAAHLYE